MRAVEIKDLAARSEEVELALKESHSKENR
jgi:hypothetical protein